MTIYMIIISYKYRNVLGFKEQSWFVDAKKFLYKFLIFYKKNILMIYT